MAHAAEPRPLTGSTDERVDHQPLALEHTLWATEWRCVLRRVSPSAPSPRVHVGLSLVAPFPPSLGVGRLTMPSDPTRASHEMRCIASFDARALAFPRASSRGVGIRRGANAPVAAW